MEVYTTRKGAIGIIIDNYRFRRDRERKSNISWRCCNCKSRCVTNLELTKLISEPTLHSHHPEEQAVLDKFHIRAACKRAAVENLHETASKIVNKESLKFEFSEFTESKSLKNSIYRARRKACLTEPESPAYVYYDYDTDTDRVPSVSLPHESGGQQYPTKQEMIDADMSHRANAAEEDDVDTPSCAVQGGNSSTISSTQEGTEDTVQATERVLQEGESIKEEPNSDDEYFLEYKDVSCSQGTQTDLTMEDVQRLYSRYSLLSCLNGGSAGIFDEIKFKNNESNVKYYTGLPDWNVLSSLVTFVNSNKSLTSIAGLTSFQEILLVLIKLRLGLADKLLSDLFGIQTPTVELIFLKVLYDMYRKLLFLIDWPDKKLIPTMPDAFLSRFGQHAVFITSCFKILVAKPCSVGDGESTHSSKKCTSSVKYLIAHTPEGSVCFLSNGWDGDQSGEYIKEHSGFLGKLEPDDIVLSGEGLGETNMEFTTGVDTHTVNLDSLSSEVQSPALEKNSSKGTDEVGVHIDKIIGSLQEEYKILTSVMPVDYLIKVESTSGVPVLIVDRIVAVCACLNNLVHLGGYMIPSS